MQDANFEDLLSDTFWGITKRGSQSIEATSHPG